MLERNGEKLPDALANPPQLALGLSIYLQAFNDLDSERHNMQGVIGRIPWSAVVLYAEVNNFDYRQRQSLIHHIRKMDSAFIEFLRNK
jgi:hypothetical protein